MHPIHGTWKIIAHCPLGELPSTDEIVVEGDTFTGVMHDERSGRDYPLVNGKIQGDHVTFQATMRLGLMTLTFDLEGDVSEDGKHCRGTARAMRMEGTFQGVKLD